MLKVQTFVSASGSELIRVLTRVVFYSGGDPEVERSGGVNG
jgi:hypothetical protein